MDSSILDYLTQRFVLFSCEGTDEGVIIQRLYDDGRLVVPRDCVVMDNKIVNRPYTRLRKASQIADEYFGMSYESDDASGLTVARIVDSRSGGFELPRRSQNGTRVLSFYTRPEIEMLIIHAEAAFGDWQRASRRNRQLKPSEFCKQELGFSSIKETGFLRGYWSDGSKLVNAIRMYAEKARRGSGDLLLADLIV